MGSHSEQGNHKSRNWGGGAKTGERFFVVLDALPLDVPALSKTPKVGRNAPCPCGSGKKYWDILDICFRVSLWI